MKIRNAVVDDFLAIHLLNMFGLDYDYPADKTKKRLAYILLKPHSKVIVAEVDGNVVGYVHAEDYDCTYSDSTTNILAIVVDEDYRGNDIGRNLLIAVEKWAYSSGSSGIRLVSSAYRTGAHKFYEACGYTLRKEQKNYVKMFYG